MTLTPVPHVVYSDFGVSRITKSGDQWKLNLALQSIPTIMCNGDAFSDDDFQMKDTNFGRLLAFRLHPGTYEVSAKNQSLSDGGYQMFCRNYPDGGSTHEDFYCEVSNPFARLCTIASGGSLALFDYPEPAEILDDLWVTWVLFRTSGIVTVDPDTRDAWFPFSRSGSGSHEPHVGTTRYVGSSPEKATHEAPYIMDITYTKANIIQSKNRVV